jgi:hypothetical protein
MKTWKKLVLPAAALAAATMLGTGVAWAAGVTLPFSGDGNTINGCYSSGGALKLLTPSAPTCPSGYTPIQWNQTGPAGPRGPSDAYLASDGGKPISLTGTTLVSLTLPAGNYTLTAKTGVYSLTNADIVDCLLQAGTTTLDEDEVRVDGLSTANDDNEFMDLIGVVSLASAGTVSVVCTSSSSASENTQLLATQVATLHQS